MDEIKGIARVKFHPGKRDEWKRLTEQAMDIVRTRDPGTVQYEVFFNGDESEAIVFERYRDADERNDLLNEVKKLGLYPSDFVLDDNPEGKNLSRKLEELTDQEFSALIDVFSRYCRAKSMVTKISG